MQRKQIVAGNWKMNMDFDEGRDLAFSIIRKLGPLQSQVVLCPPFIHLNYLSVLTKGIANLSIGAQNCHGHRNGAFTGEIAASMLRSVGCGYVIVGHSERREYFAENDELLARKVDAAIANDLMPIFCVGEKLEVREAGTHEKKVEQQLKGGLFHLDKTLFPKVVVAYEPVWAIGTGKTASPQQAQEMHAFIRKTIAKKYGKNLAGATSILYGGSVKPSNAKELFENPDVDGGLIGGASLKASDFIDIVNSFPKD